MSVKSGKGVAILSAVCDLQNERGVKEEEEQLLLLVRIDVESTTAPGGT